MPTDRWTMSPGWYSRMSLTLFAGEASSCSRETTNTAPGLSFIDRCVRVPVTTILSSDAALSQRAAGADFVMVSAEDRESESGAPAAPAMQQNRASSASVAVKAGRLARL